MLWFLQVVMVILKLGFFKDLSWRITCIPFFVIVGIFVVQTAYSTSKDYLKSD